MNTYLILLRGINVGVKNRIKMAELKLYLEELGFENVMTYIQSGNIIVKTKLDAKETGRKIENSITKKFKLDSERIKVLVLTKKQLQSVIDKRPKGFGDEPQKYYSDAIFLIDIGLDEALKVFQPREGVDTIWPGHGVIYSRRLSAQRTKSRLSKIIGTPVYKSLTIRSWNTTTKLLELMKD